MPHRCGATCSADCRIEEAEAQRLTDPLERCKDAQKDWLNAREALLWAGVERSRIFNEAFALGQGFRDIGRAVGIHYTTVWDVIERAKRWRSSLGQW